MNNWKIILLADDDADDCLLFNETIIDFNSQINVITTSNGAELLHKLHQMEELPDGIFLDINMPILTGIESLAKIRSDEKYGNVPVIMLTTSQNGFDVEKAFNNGANLYICKPTLVSEYENIVNSLSSVNWPDLFPPSGKQFLMGQKREL